MGDKLPDHFYMAPSSAHRWINCPGSLKALIGVEDDAGEAAERGTLGHHLAELDLTGKPLEDPERSQLEQMEKEERDRLESEVELCVELVSGLEGDKFYETKIQHELIPEHGGTVDVIVVDGDTLHVIDFKFGRVKVDVDDNQQIQCYLNLARQRFPDATRFLGSIIQPSVSSQMQTVEFTLEQLQDQELSVLEASVSDHFAAGDHCKFCPLLPSCKTAAKHLQEQIKEFPDVTQFVSQIEGQPTPEQIELMCKMYRTHKLAEKATKQSGDVLKRWALGGSDVQAFGVGVRTSYRQKWVDNHEKVLTDTYQIDLEAFKEFKMTPNQFRQAIEFSKEDFEDQFGDSFESTPIRSVTLGKDINDFPEFDD